MMQATTVNFEPAAGYTSFHDEPDSGPTQQNAYNSSNPNQSQQQQPQRKYRHPVPLFFHLFFKVAAIIMYLIGFFVFNNFVISFVIITMLVAFDFWTVKNVTGRRLAGLRWWNEINDDGTNRWVFESLQDRSSLDTGESMIFWISLFVTPAVWILFLLSAILPPKPSYLVIVLVALSLNCANVVGYMKCRKDAKKKLEGAATNFVIGQMFNRATNMV
jgi:hypothetical protein